MNRRVAVFGVSGTGCTFVDWSIHWLSGQNDYYSHAAQQWVPLADNPLGQFNAHRHPKNHPEGMTAVLDMLTAFDQDKIYGMYVSSSPWQQVAQQLNTDQLPVITEYLAQEASRMWQECSAQGAQLVYVRTDPAFKLRNLTTRSVASSADQATVDQKTHRAYQQFFPHSNYDQLPIWEQRELMALDIRPFEPVTILDQLDLSLPHVSVDCVDLFEHGESVMQAIMQHCEIEIDPARWAAWITVYRAWQQIHEDSIRWAINCDHIVRSTVMGWHCPINLTFYQEAVIQHCLIYQYGLNLKCFGLTQFPNNTKLLHSLLEPNHHPVTPY